MTETEQIAAVIVQAVKAATAPLSARMLALETRALVPGPAGRDGVDGKDAPVVDVEALVRAAVEPLVARCAALEAQIASQPVELSADEIASTLTELFRKELPVEPVQWRTRILRDAQGRAESVVKEPIA